MRRYTCIEPGSVIVFNPNYFNTNPYFNQLIGVYHAPNGNDMFIGTDALYGTVLDFNNPSDWMLMSDFVDYYWALNEAIKQFEPTTMEEISDLSGKVDFVNKVIKYAETIRKTSVIDEDEDTACKEIIRCIATAANIITGYSADSKVEYTLSPDPLPKNTELYTAITFDIAVLSDLEPLSLFSGN